MTDLYHPGVPSGQPIWSPSAPLLKLKGLTYVHQDTVLLHEIDLQLARHGITLLLGPNGAGKSLLMRLAHGLIAPTSGDVIWHTQPDMPPLLQAMVFQHPVMLRRTALANLTYALAARRVPWRRRRALAMETLERFGLISLAQRQARVLSGGEQQRLALARAWVLKPEVLFLDEPTSALDPASMRAVEEAVHAFHAEGTRIVMSSHDLNQARRLADDVVLLCGGRLVEHTPAERFFQGPRTPEARAFIRGELIW
ncbi:ATP-binding cassette domain-containing protein [Billgrantia endophytica]|uniref:ABC transporter ATP-binding protein n=1 Tax=Billgrantia endophytica TaxID=2033802 RepID=A0A2N7TWM6_9GAMM|nr:ATP-binding cassette domain-containing protein [Halomonas endophytica]PMR72586.1 ABC transporter ATP-binding protein [Halomonas endophytica]